jgi:hypothetical protein
VAKSDYTHPSLALHGRHVPEPEGNTDPSAYDVANPTTGFYEIGVEIDGVFVPIFRESASKVLGIVEHGLKSSPVEPEPEGAVAPTAGPSERERELQERVAVLERERQERERGEPGPSSPSSPSE